jgi:hypothetical protein
LPQVGPQPGDQDADRRAIAPANQFGRAATEVVTPSAHRWTDGSAPVRGARILFRESLIVRCEDVCTY